MKLLDNGMNGKSRDNNNIGGHNNYYSIGNGISEIKETTKKLEDRSLSPNKRGSIMEDNESNIITVSLDDLIRHFPLLEIFLEMEVVI